jgi:hypothetical protein
MWATAVVFAKYGLAAREQFFGPQLPPVQNCFAIMAAAERKPIAVAPARVSRVDCRSSLAQRGKD